MAPNALSVKAHNEFSRSDEIAFYYLSLTMNAKKGCQRVSAPYIDLVRIVL
jgi:hypothetical protein